MARGRGRGRMARGRCGGRMARGRSRGRGRMASWGAPSTSGAVV
jgi:hypothetical protein